MTIPEIIKELELCTGRFPMQAMRAAVEQREAITPELLRVLESVADNPAEWAKRSDYMLHVFALYLLAQFREMRAYPLAIKIFSAPGELPFDLFDDTVTGGLSQILASLYDGNPAPLQGLVESEQVNEYVRSAALDALVVLEHTGLMPRDTVVAYFHSLFHGKLQQTHSYAWDSLVCTVADMPAPELLKEVRRAYAEGLVDSTVADLASIERDLAASKPLQRERRHLITDAIAEMECWDSFHLEDFQTKKLPEIDILPPPASNRPDSYLARQPFVRGLKVGRNDPCLCGSGKKYKKCCGKD